MKRQFSRLSEFDGSGKPYPGSTGTAFKGRFGPKIKITGQRECENDGRPATVRYTLNRVTHVWCSECFVKAVKKEG